MRGFGFGLLMAGRGTAAPAETVWVGAGAVGVGASAELHRDRAQGYLGGLKATRVHLISTYAVGLYTLWVSTLCG